MSLEQHPQAGLGAILDQRIAHRFGVQEDAVLIANNEHPVYRAGDVIIRQESDPEEAAFVASLCSSISAKGFRVARPITSTSGAFVTDDGWTACAFLTGKPATADDAPHVVAAIAAYHEALAPTPKPSILKDDDSPFIRADKMAWNELETTIDHRITPLVGPLQARLQPLDELKPQLIHGDLNPHNILIEPSVPPGIIDIAPYWRPPEFAQAVAAYWLGPLRGDRAVLAAFSRVQAFDQMLLRAGLRMLFIRNEFGNLNDLSAYATASRIICEWVDRC